MRLAVTALWPWPLGCPQPPSRRIAARPAAGRRRSQPASPCGDGILAFDAARRSPSPLSSATPPGCRPAYGSLGLRSADSALGRDGQAFWSSSMPSSKSAGGSADSADSALSRCGRGLLQLVHALGGGDSAGEPEPNPSSARCCRKACSPNRRLPESVPSSCA